jgi:hypothetical protein
LVLVGLAVGACVSPISLEDRRCPCIQSGYRCCEATRICVRQTLACPAAEAGVVEEPPLPSPDAPVILIEADAGQLPLPGEAPPDGPRAPREAAPAAPDAAPAAPNAAPAPPDAALALPDASPPDAPAAPAADAAPDPDGPDPLPRWQTLAQTGLSEHLATSFDLRIAEDGTPFLVLSKLKLPGPSRATVVLRYDGSAWQPVGPELPGSEVLPGFVLAGNGTAYVLVNGVVTVLEPDGSRELPGPRSTIFIPPSPLGLARDAQGRFYSFAGQKMPSGGYLLGVARLTGTSWELLGPPDSFGRAPTPRVLQLAADRDSPYVAVNDLDEVFTDVRRWNGSDWSPVGGGTFIGQRGVLLVAPGGQTYFAPPGGLPIQKGSATAPWIELPALPVASDPVDLLPGLAAGAGDVLHVAYLGDRDPGPDVVPGAMISRLEGERFAALTVAGLEPEVFDSVKLAVARSGGAEVLYLAFSRELRIVVKRLQR